MFQEIIEQINLLKGNNGYWILYIASYIAIIVLKNKEGIEYLLKPIFGVGLIIFNPIIAVVLNICLQSSYWRSIWLLQECIVISYAMVLLIKKGKKKIFISIMILIICLSGKNIYINNYFSIPDNAYKIPDEMIEINILINENISEPYVASVYPVYIWIRQYDAKIGLAYGKNGGENELRNLVNSSERDYVFLKEKLNEYGCNVLVIRKDEVIKEEVEQLGYEYIANTDNYVIYRVL